jgi:hypothetical protein
LLDPVIEWTFDALLRNKLIPPLPEELQDAEIDIEYTGPIPRSMKNEEAQGTSMWLSEMSMLSQQGLPDIIDVVDTDATARGLGLARGVPANYMRTEDEVEAIRTQRAEYQQQMAEMQMAQEAGAGMTSIAEGQAALEGGEETVE